LFLRGVKLALHVVILGHIDRREDAWRREYAWRRRVTWRRNDACRRKDPYRRENAFSSDLVVLLNRQRLVGLASRVNGFAVFLIEDRSFLFDLGGHVKGSL